MPRKTDGNQAQIVKELERAGYHVTDLSVVGGGVPDLIVTGFNQLLGHVIALFVEVKRADGKGRHTPAQKVWYDKFPADGPLLKDVRKTEDVLAWFGMV